VKLYLVSSPGRLEREGPARDLSRGKRGRSAGKVPPRLRGSETTGTGVAITRDRPEVKRCLCRPYGAHIEIGRWLQPAERAVKQPFPVLLEPVEVLPVCCPLSTSSPVETT
jgi:hypothetical protein